MPKASRRCPAKGCKELIKHTKYCETHTEAWATPSGWQKPKDWDKTRNAVLERDDWICYLCGRPGADTADHITPVSQGGTHTMGNLAAVHDRTPPHCHRTKTNQDKAIKVKR